MRDFTRKGKAYLKTVGGTEGDLCNYPTRLDTYGCGCAHDCSYCYAKSLLEFRNLWDSKHPKVTDAWKIMEQIKKLRRGSVVRLGGMTDCFQPIERDEMVTYNTIHMLNKRGVHYLIVTKSNLVADPTYLNVMDKELAHIQISVTTTDDELSKTYEHAPVPSKRIEAIEKLQAEGFDVALRLSPFIPQYIDFDILNRVKCEKILVEFLRVNHWIRKWFDIDYTEYTLKQGDYSHLPLEKETRIPQEHNGIQGIIGM